jgi:5-methylcytosine-specific restriction protein B
LQHIYDDAINSKDSVFFSWFPRYEKQVTYFIDIAKNDNWDEQIINELIFKQDNSIANFGQGFLRNTDKNKIEFDEIKSLITDIVNQDIITNEQYKNIISFFSTPKLSRKYKLIVNRLVASFLPNIVTTTANESNFNELIHKLKNVFIDYPNIENNWLIDNKNFIKYVNEKVHFKHKWHSSVFAWYLYKNLTKLNTQINITNSNMKNNIPHIPKNQILYGPPGTGKTYSTVDLALDILGASDRKNDITSIGKLKEEFGDQVEFITFHQSFSYEDFVEGLKANSDGEKMTYNIEDGIFKKICENAKNSGNDSLSNLNEVINKLKEQLSEESLELKTLVKHKPFTLTNQTKNGFYAQPNDGNSYNPVNITSITEFYKNPDLKDMRTGAIFKSYVMPVIKYLKDKFKLENYQETTDKKPHILIIDEINRGNISQIFGELITLLEETKRTGQKEAITLQLPYSKESFSVPDNLYIIGTMNTADRSLTMMDTALRRRFDFIEMLPNADLVNGNFNGIDVKEILLKINERIEILYDREHLIGHSFLIKVENLKQLKNAFKNKILPLLEEYFYDDFEKINLVLGSDNFYKKQEPNLFKDEQYNKAIYKKQNIEELSAQAFIDIYAE